jgi:hypothetical protein
MVKSRFKNALLAATASVTLLMAAEAHATVVLTFEGLQNKEEILSYYSGGNGSLGSGPGPSYGITFGSTALASISSLAGGTGNFRNEPSPSTALFFGGTASSGVMDVTSGFTDELSFYYSAVGAGTVTVKSGLDGTGSMLATLTLPDTGNNGPSGSFFNMWDQVSVSFAGPAESVVFSGTVNGIGFDNITLGAVPAPALGHGLTGALAVGGILVGAKLLERGRRRRSLRTA